MTDYNIPLHEFFKEELKSGKKIKWVRRDKKNRNRNGLAGTIVACVTTQLR